MTDRWKAEVDRHVCVRTGLCAATAPGEFDLDERGQGRAMSETLPSTDAVLEIAESCPVEAITLTDPATGSRIFPPEN